MKDETLKGIAIGVGLTAAALAARSALRGDTGRLLLRATLKSGILAYEKARETLAEVAEDVEDIYAEVQDELRQARAAAEDTAPGDSDETP
ncbi:hypothetical protein MIT9_P0213 [Methylomarinovum caldicuralii]|uniref:DUF1490 family protein n=1 Tax=Methylomarinovum caldicuralii TaxID=438856 RepID=A0AAU9C4C5_9GAMM|nr:DUF5132 domain-containing protein [Methylomarinovum caldicuralii]BCX80639.1 hypothetical protein MIT9_P0213 [Methylomarinovum caldicuralii]